MYKYLLFDKYMNPIIIAPSDIGIVEYVKKHYENITDFDVNDAVHLFNALFSTNRQLLNAIVNLYNAKHPEDEITCDLFYVKLSTSRKYDNIYGLPICSDYKTKDTPITSKSDNIIIPILYKEDYEVAHEFLETENLTIKDLCAPTLTTIYCHIGTDEPTIDFNYTNNPSKGEFAKSLYNFLFSIIKQRYKDVTKNDYYKKAAYKYLLDTTFQTRSGNGDFFVRTILDLILFCERLYSLYGGKNKEFVIDFSMFDADTLDKLMSFSSFEFRNFSEASIDFPTEKVEKFTATEMEDTQLLNRLNAAMDSDFTIDDLNDELEAYAKVHDGESKYR